jgi:glucose-1-phosphate thymidylyltransferase
MPSLKIVIPTGGLAKRMRPQTWSKPKPLVSVAGKTVLDHLLGMFACLPPGMPVEYVIILGPHLGETQIPAHMQAHHPEKKVQYILQPEMKGQADALWLARQHLTGPMLVCFSDTLIQSDFSFLAAEQTEAVIWVKPVPDPRRFGVVEMDPAGWVKRLVEKPSTFENNLAVVGCYYFRQAEEVVAAVEEQVRKKITRQGEYFLADTINLMIAGGLQMRTCRVDTWLDTGTIPAILETNRFLLQHGSASHLEPVAYNGGRIIPPVFIHAGAEVSDSVIGPFVSISANCQVRKAVIEDSILEPGSMVENAALKASFLGCNARVTGDPDRKDAWQLNIGDDSSVSVSGQE